MRNNLVIIALLMVSSVLVGQTASTLEIMGRRPLGEEVTGSLVVHPVRPIYVLRKDGRPVVSEAGYLQLLDSGPGFYYASLLGDRVEWARSIGLVGTNNWGAVEAMCFIGHVVAAWREKHADVRLGIDEISSRFSSFPDYDNDGISDHLTHQAGMNINLFLPCRQKPEVTIHVGNGRNEELYDASLYGELIDLLLEMGAFRLTTNAGLGILDDPERAKQWREVKRSANGYSITYEAANKRSRLYLLTPKGDHGDHVNVLMWKGH